MKIIKELTYLGVVSPNWLRDIRIFELFHSLPSDLCVYCKYEVIADREGISSERVKHIVLKLGR
ncbi:hypothetical protein [Neptunitalea lumnitzerae]|uniref:hypothetical protein n=1 Tax=Neptunitalea lumnitzerae TaxID=2965509 RepID=UPI00248FFAE7|nr:hypothetical protein [Neptunitalea sp. Y10]